MTDNVDDNGDFPGMSSDSAIDPSGSLDLTPRAAVSTPSRRRKLLPTMLLGLVLVGLGFVLLRTLGDAALFFYNADEAIERRSDLVTEEERQRSRHAEQRVGRRCGRDAVGNLRLRVRVAARRGGPEV